MGRTACTEPQCLYKGALYLYLCSWKSKAIPLLPLWAVRPVQSLSSCTRVHFTFTFAHERVKLYLFSPYGPYGLYKGALYLYLNKRYAKRFTAQSHLVILKQIVTVFQNHILKPWKHYTDQLILYRKTAAVCPEIHTTTINVLCRQIWVSLYKLRGTYSYHYTNMRHLTTGIRYEICVVVRTCTYTNLDSTAYYIPRLYGIAYCS